MTIAEKKTATAAASSSMVVSAHRGGVEVVERWAEAWHNLCDESVDDQPFYHPEWIAAHIRAFTPTATVLLFTVSCEDRLCLVLPLLEERTFFSGLPLRRLRAPVNSHSCRFDAVRCSGPQGDHALRALWDQFAKLASWDFLEFSYIPLDGTLSALADAAEANDFHTARVPMLPNPYIPLPSDPAGLQKLPVNKRLRTQLRSIHRELAGKGTLELKRFADANQSALRRFYELEAAGWKGAEGSAIACSPQTRQFYDEISKSAERLGYLCLYTLELDGQLLASHLGLSHKGRYFSPKVAYAENFKQWAPGHLVVEQILQDCVARNIREYDITGPNDEWKSKWASESRPQNIQFIFRKSIAGDLGYALRFRLRPWLKKIIRKQGPKEQAG